MATQPERDDDGVSLELSSPSLADAASRSSRPGPRPRDDSLRALIAAGTARWLKSAVPVVLQKQVSFEALRREVTASQIVTEALEQYFEQRKQPEEFDFGLD